VKKINIFSVLILLFSGSILNATNFLDFSSDDLTKHILSFTSLNDYANVRLANKELNRLYNDNFPQETTVRFSNPERDLNFFNIQSNDVTNEIQTYHTTSERLAQIYVEIQVIQMMEFNGNIRDKIGYSNLSRHNYTWSLSLALDEIFNELNQTARLVNILDDALAIVADDFMDLNHDGQENLNDVQMTQQLRTNINQLVSNKLPEFMNWQSEDFWKDQTNLKKAIILALIVEIRKTEAYINFIQSRADKYRQSFDDIDNTANTDRILNIELQNSEADCLLTRIFKETIEKIING
jgi:hypothetical protein